MTISQGETYEFTSVPPGAAVLQLPGGSFVLSIATSMAIGSYSLGWKRSSGVVGAKAFQVN